MIFKIKLGDIEPRLKKRFALQEENKTPVFYFESDNELFVYVETERGNILSSSIQTESLDSVAFKQEYLADAVELTEKPKGFTFVIKQE